MPSDTGRPCIVKSPNVRSAVAWLPLINFNSLLHFPPKWIDDIRHSHDADTPLFTHQHTTVTGLLFLDATAHKQVTPYLQPCNTPQYTHQHITVANLVLSIATAYKYKAPYLQQCKQPFLHAPAYWFRSPHVKRGMAAKEARSMGCRLKAKMSTVICRDRYGCTQTKWACVCVCMRVCASTRKY